MCTAAEPCAEINGVALYTQAGKPKTKYKDQERRKILGATNEEVEEFVNLFCLGRPHFAITRAKSTDPRDWTTPRGRLSLTDIMNHLLGNRLPEKNPRWVAPHCWEVTRWIGIDVDLRNGNHKDFHHRCRWIRRKLKKLGVRAEHLLVSKTPSGGRHYRFFLDRKIRVWEIENLFRSIGVEEKSGQIELFPKVNKGMRLPFGYLPGETFNPEAWLRFIREYRQGRFPVVPWRKIVTLAARFAGPAGSSSRHPVKQSPATSPAREYPERPMNLSQQPLFRPRTGDTENYQSQYMSLLEKSADAFTTADAYQLWELGICNVGTRVAATKKMAWHLCHVRKLTKDVAIRELTAWVYGTAADTSNDVQQDRKNGTRLVAEQTRQIVEWIYQHPSKGRSTVKVQREVTAEEKSLIVRQLEQHGLGNDRKLLDFALQFLGYCKKQGQATENGWTAHIAAAEVMRKWPGCSGSMYKERREALAAIGLIQTTDRRQRMAFSQSQWRRPSLCVCLPTATQSCNRTYPQLGQNSTGSTLLGKQALHRAVSFRAK